MARSKRKMVKMMLAVVIVFTLCWLPFNTLLVATFSHKEHNIPYLQYIWLVLHWLAMSHSCYNPIIYCFMNARFRAGFQHVLASIPCCKRCSPLAGRTSRSTMGFRRAGSDSTDSTLLHRVNTGSMYITMRHKSMSASSQQPLRSSVTRYSTRSSQRTLHQPETFREDQI
ncbi:RYamide receptor [Carabus blaptoides fortunei]